MNEHDSERMKGMLESLGYAEVADRQDVVFWPLKPVEDGG